MKNLIFLLFLLLIQIGVSAQNYSFKNLVGYWKSGDGGAIEVIDSSKIFIVYGDEKKKIASYQADFSKNPCWFDFDIKDSTQNLSLKSLLLFVNDDLLQWQVFDDGVRPSNFNSEKGDIVYLRRNK